MLEVTFVRETHLVQVSIVVAVVVVQNTVAVTHQTNTVVIEIVADRVIGRPRL